VSPTPIELRGSLFMNLSKSTGSLCKTGAVLRFGDQIFAARWRELGISRGFRGEIFSDFFAGWWRKLINGAQRALFE
jgi:hypothetical protein